MKTATKPGDRFTTGQIARMAAVAPRTVSKWIDSGRLHGYRIPGSNDRRVMRADLEAFGREYGIPLPGIVAATTGIKVLCVNVNSGEKLREILEDLGCTPIFAWSTFTAGVIMAVEKPSVIVVDTAIGRIDAMIIAYGVRGTCRGAKLVAIVHSEDHGIGEPFQFFLHANFGHAQIREILSHKEASL